MNNVEIGSYLLYFLPNQNPFYRYNKDVFSEYVNTCYSPRTFSCKDTSNMLHRSVIVS